MAIAVGAEVRAVDPRRVVAVALGLATLLPFVSPPVALGLGLALALAWGNPLPPRLRRAAPRLLAGSVIGLGADRDLGVVLRVGLHGLGAAAVGIAAAIVLGVTLGRALGVSRHAALLVTLGTAICGGSAIAAASPVIGASEEDVSVALVTVFVLNAAALLVFPAVGHAVGLDATRFGMWCALAIHDTSSVVGAAASWGGAALDVATAAKLARALWIVPVTIGLSVARARSRAAHAPAPARPWFIGGFVATAALVTAVPALRPAGHVVAALAHRGLALTLFVIGLGLTRPALRAVGLKPLLLGLVLWASLATATLLAITRGWID